MAISLDIVVPQLDVSGMYFVEDLVGKEDNRYFTYTSSGFGALTVALKLLNVKRAVIPDFCLGSTLMAAKLQNIHCLVADVDSQTGCLSIPCVEEFGPDEYDSIIVTCPLSTVPNLEAMQDFCLDRNKKLIVECFSSFGTRDLCNLGDAVCYSFHNSSVLPVGGLGALVVGEADRLTAQSLVDGLGLSPGLHSVEAAATMEQQVREEVGARLRNAAVYRDRVGHLVPKSWGDPVYNHMPLFVNSKYFTTQIRNFLSQQDVETKSAYTPLLGRTASADLYSRNICLPVHSGVTESDIEHIVWSMSRV